MIAVIIFFVSAVAVCQFGLYYWRATIAAVAAQPISDRLWVAAGIAPTNADPYGFRAMISLLNLAPELRGSSRDFRAIRIYYKGIETLGRFIPSTASWAQNEMATCSKYVAAILDQRFERNFACASEIYNN